ncbi:Dual specificity phosphatase, catalytic domain [Prosthecobacter debontii]|uniref:Dual specificity phosphatase, catalytic domain n=1 Tax=Prosthecobacter debontii TaxID=48467 RepID=A0A1T4XM95_9BACT|nr:phosphatase PAP2/dual specificity phosphatase family protein [Prosthecobacter debontii]SKA90503.1 Dual specificity phosphatase, catalytic domain [Prosthecobacter debontii]
MSPPPSRPTFLQAAQVSALTSLCFLVIYNVCNWLTSLRPDVQTAAFGWERWIPVWDWMILPYWSLDAFFVVAPFLCSDRQELSLLKRRLVAANVIAGVCFLIIPLELAWTRPQVTGMWEPWFRAIQSMDAPHNLFPSLHIVLRTIMAVHYAQHSRGVMRSLLHVWFSLIGLSTLLTWQHHLVDVLGGFLLAAVVFHVAPKGDGRLNGNRRVGGYYLAATAVLLFACRLAPPWTLALAWPAAACGTAAAAYFGQGARVLQKTRGRLPRVTQWLMAPWLLGQETSWWWYRRQSPEYNKLTSHVWMGSLPDEKTAVELIEAGVTDMVDLTAEFDAPEAFLVQPGYRNFPVADLTAPTRQQLLTLAEHIERVRKEGIVFVFCKAGYSRTAAAIGAWLLQSGGTTEAAIRQMQEARPGMIIRPEVVRALHELEAYMTAPGRAPVLS